MTPPGHPLTALSATSHLSCSTSRHGDSTVSLAAHSNAQSPLQWTNSSWSPAWTSPGAAWGCVLLSCCLGVTVVSQHLPPPSHLSPGSAGAVELCCSDPPSRLGHLLRSPFHPPECPKHSLLLDQNMDSQELRHRMKVSLSTGCSSR